MPIQVNENGGYTIETACNKLEEIFAELQANGATHDMWDWMEAGICVDVIRAAMAEPKAADGVSEAGGYENGVCDAIQPGYKNASTRGCIKPAGHTGLHCNGKNYLWRSSKPSAEQAAELEIAPVPYEEHERELTEVIKQRDAAEEALSQAYFLVIGESPEWSNLFGHDQALEAIEDAVTLLRKSVALPVPDQAPVDGRRGTAWIAEIEAMALACDRLVLDAPLLNIKELRCRVEALSPFLQRLADIEQANPPYPELEPSAELLERGWQQAQQLMAEADAPAPRVEEIRRRYKAATAMVSALCNRDREWIMSIPARPEHDPDLVIAAALADIPELLSELDRLREGR